MVGVSPEYILSVTSTVSLIFGIIIFCMGISIRFKVTNYINYYGADLEEEVPLDVCVDPTTNIDFCMRSHDVQAVYLGPWIITLGSIVIITGFLVMILSLLSIIAGCRGFRRLLVLVIIVISGALGMEAYLVDIITNEESAFHDQAKEDLLDALNENYRLAEPPIGPSRTLTQTFNTIMLQGECCGITGREDFGQNLTFTKEDIKPYHFLSPPVCITRELLKEKKFKSFSLMVGCQEELASMADTENINTQGCYSTLFKYFFETYGVAAYSLLLFLIIWHIIDIVLAVIILMRPVAPLRKAGKRTSDTSTRQSFIKGSNQQQLPKRFIPYAKTSSFVGSNLDRMKSTEIW